MPRALHEVREGSDGKRAQARVNLEKASQKMILELGFEQRFTYGVGRIQRQTLSFGGHSVRVGVKAALRRGREHSTVTFDGER